MRMSGSSTAWMRIWRFLRKGMGGVYIQYGQSACGLEIGSIKISNSMYSARNIRDQWPVVYFD